MMGLSMTKESLPSDFFKIAVESGTWNFRNDENDDLPIKVVMLPFKKDITEHRRSCGALTQKNTLPKSMRIIKHDFYHPVMTNSLLLKP